MNFLGTIGQQLLSPFNKDGEGGEGGERTAGFEVNEFEGAAGADANAAVAAAAPAQAAPAPVSAGEKKDTNIDRSSFNVISKAATDRLGEVQRMIESHNWKENTAIVIPPCFHLVDAAFRVIRGVVTKKQLFMIRQKLSNEEMKNVTPKYTNVYGIYFMIIATSRKLAKHVLGLERAKLSNAGVAAAMNPTNEHQEPQMEVISGDVIDNDAAAAAATAKATSSALSILSSTATASTGSNPNSNPTAAASAITHDLISSENGAVSNVNITGSGEAPVAINPAPMEMPLVGEEVTPVAPAAAAPKDKKVKLEARPLDISAGQGTPLGEIPEIWNVIMQESTQHPTNIYYLCGLLHCFKERSCTISSTQIYLGHLNAFKGFSPSLHPDFILERMKIYSKHWKMEVFEQLHTLFGLPPISLDVNKKFQKGELLKAIIAFFYRPMPPVSAGEAVHAISSEFTVGYKKRETTPAVANTVTKAERVVQDTLSGAEVVILKRKAADNTLLHPNEAEITVLNAPAGMGGAPNLMHRAVASATAPAAPVAASSSALPMGIHALPMEQQQQQQQPMVVGHVEVMAAPQHEPPVDVSAVPAVAMELMHAPSDAGNAQNKKLKTGKR